MAVEEFETARLRMVHKWGMHLVADLHRIAAELPGPARLSVLQRALRDPCTAKPDVTEEQFVSALLEDGHEKDCDPEDEESRSEFRQACQAIGMQGPDDLKAGVQLMMTTWRSVNTALAVAATNLATVATSLGFSEQDVACADELALVLRRLAHRPSTDELPLVRAVEVMAIKVLRAVDTPIDCERDACCIKIAELLKGQNLTSTRLVERCHAGGFNPRMAEDRIPRMAEQELIHKNGRNAPYSLLAKGRSLFFPTNGKG